MHRFTRRSFLRGLATAGAAGAFLSIVPRGLLVRRAMAAQPEAGEAFGTIFIHLRGGLDPFMHYDARTGLVNRDVTAGRIRETAAGLRWYEDTLSPLAPHIEEASLIRNLSVSSAHPQGSNLLWYGERRDGEAAGATPWANYLSAQLLARGKVPAPNLGIYAVNNNESSDYVAFNNTSPSPDAAMQRVRGLQDFSNSLDVLNGLPDPAFQLDVFNHVDKMDQRVYSELVQGPTTADFATSNNLANELLNEPLPIIWPPEQNVIDLFNLPANDVNRTIGQGNQVLRANLALAYQMLRSQLSFTFFIQSTQGGYDSHNAHVARQKGSSEINIPAIADLLAALKATESPVRPGSGLSMFDTTHVIVTSELSRANRIDNGDGLDGQGTPHWPWTQALLFGGAFKRGYVFGDVDENLMGVAADLATGALNQGSVPTIKNLHATILEANGVNPTGWTDAQPITAVLGG